MQVADELRASLLACSPVLELAQVLQHFFGARLEPGVERFQIRVEGGFHRPVPCHATMSKGGDEFTGFYFSETDFCFHGSYKQKHVINFLAFAQTVT